MSRRVLLLILSVVVAAVGTGLIALYVKGADDRAASDQELVEVLVASQSIPAGTTAEVIARTSLLTTGIPRAAVPDGSLVGADAPEKFQAGYLGRYAAVNIPKGQPIVPDSFSGAGTTSAGGVPENLMGVVLAMGNPERAIGLIRPGSPVTVFVTRGRTTRVLIPKATVLAVDSERSTEGDGSAGGDQRADATVTLGVGTRDVARLIQAKNSSVVIYMAVPGTKLEDSDIRSQGSVTITDVIT